MILRVVRLGDEGQPWFVAKDICDPLGLQTQGATKYLEPDERAVITNPGLTANPNGKVTLVSESGLYALILKSRKPEAKKFRRWVTGTVLPALRKDGLYIAGEMWLGKVAQQDNRAPGNRDHSRTGAVDACPRTGIAPPPTYADNQPPTSLFQVPSQ